MWQKIGRAIAQECGNVLRWHRLGGVATAVFPVDSLHLVRTLVLRLLGWQLGEGVLFASTPRLLGSGRLLRRLTIGRESYVNAGAVLELGAAIHIGERVHVGQGVSLITTSHAIGDASCRAGNLDRQPIVVGNGVWLSAGCTVLPGVTIGDGAIVAADCLVRSDVPPNCVFGGVPGRVIRQLDTDDVGSITADAADHLSVVV